MYDWASRLSAESAGESAVEDYYRTPQMEKIVTKLKLTKRALIGVLGVQGAGKSATMHAIYQSLQPWTGVGDRESVVAVKVPESGTLMDALEASQPEGATLLGDGSLDYYTKFEVDDLLRRDLVLRRRIARFAYSMNKADEKAVALRSELEMLKKEPTPGKPVSQRLIDLIPSKRLRELRREALYEVMSRKEVIMIDMPDYPKHDRRLIAKDLDDVQGLWNRLMASSSASSVSFVLFLQKETFNSADHFLYGKMDIVSLIPLSVGQLLEAYKQKWGGYAPFNEDALQYIARMSHGVFRRFKRYIGLAVEAWMASAENPGGSIDLMLAKRAVTDEEIMRDMDKEFDGIFKKREQKQKALDLIKTLVDTKTEKERSKTSGYPSLSDFVPSDGDPVPEGIRQGDLAEKVGLNEMAISRLVRELEQHGYVKRTPWREWKYVDLNW